jgi:hypothetical protein
MNEEKSLSQNDNIKSPDELNGYLRVTNPSMWFIFAAVLIMLVGLIAGSAFYEIKTTVYLTAEVKNNFIYILPTSEIELTEGMTVSVEYFDSKTNTSKNYNEKIDIVEYDKQRDGYVGVIYGNDGIPEDEYSATAVRTDTPISYLFN